MKRLMIFLALVFVIAGCQSATNTPAPKPTVLTYSTPIMLPTLTPQPLTDPELGKLKQQLKAAFDAKDSDKLRDTISFSKWVGSIYRQGGTMPIDPPRGLALSMQFAKDFDLEIDAERPTYEPNWSMNDAGAAEFVRVTPKDGSAPFFAHLLIKHEPGGWRYVGIITRIPYYDAPTVAQLRADTNKYLGKEFMYVGTYQGKENPPSDAGPAPTDNAFLVNTFAGPIWVTMSEAAYVLPLPADVDTKTGQPVRLFGTVKEKNGQSYIEADSVTFISPDDFAHSRGVIEAVDAAARTVKIKSENNGATTLYLPTLAFVSLADGTRGEFADLKVGQTIDAIGVPQKDGTLLVEQLYLAK
jgi:hypothetical protein